MLLSSCNFHKELIQCALKQVTANLKMNKIDIIIESLSPNCISILELGEHVSIVMKVFLRGQTTLELFLPAFSLVNSVQNQLGIQSLLKISNCTHKLT